MMNSISSIVLLLSIAIATTNATTLTPHTTAKKYTCQSSDTPPGRSITLPSDRGTSDDGLYILLPPVTTSSQLCTITKCNDLQLCNVYIPIAKSYVGALTPTSNPPDDEYTWQVSPGVYETTTSIQCGTTTTGGGSGDTAWNGNEYLCQIKLPTLKEDEDGYYLSMFTLDDYYSAASGNGGVADNPNTRDLTLASRFLERVNWGPTIEEINELATSITNLGYTKAVASYIHNQVSLNPTSHKKYFRERLSPRAVESYQYGIPGPKACEINAHYRRFSFTYMDVELSRGSTSAAGNTGHPFTPMIVTTEGDYTVISFGGNVRTVLSASLEYYDNYPSDGILVGDETTTVLVDGSYTICAAEEVVGNQVGSSTYSHLFQVLVGDLCTSSYTNRGGVEDGLGDGAVEEDNIKVGGKFVRTYDSDACNAKCDDADLVKYITIGNPPVEIPDLYDSSDLIKLDISTLDATSDPPDIIKLDEARTHGSDWLLKVDVSEEADLTATCASLPDPAGLSYTDLNSFDPNRGKFNLDKPIFAKLPGDLWALHDFRTVLFENTLDNPLMDGGGAVMNRAARLRPTEDGGEELSLTVRCSNTDRNIFNEDKCKISYQPETCVSRPFPDPGANNRRDTSDVGGEYGEPIWKYQPPWAGADGGGVVVCGSENEVEPIPEKSGDYFAAQNRKLDSGEIRYNSQKKTTWAEVVLNADDQLCQKNAWALMKIFATSTATNKDEQNSETNIQVLDNFVNACMSTYKDVIKRASFNEEMSRQLTYDNNKAVARGWHLVDSLAYPDENYARENLQLHTIGTIKLYENGTAVLDQFGRRIANYDQSNIFESSKIWTGFQTSTRRGNYEDLDWSGGSFLDPLTLNDVNNRDWFPKKDLLGGYIGDQYPLCEDLPSRPFLKKGAKYRLLGGDPKPLWYYEPNSWYTKDGVKQWQEGKDIRRLSLDPNSALFTRLCSPKNPADPLDTLADNGSGEASYDSSLGAPACTGQSNMCDSLTLLEDNIRVGSTDPLKECGSGNDETSCTIDGCVDGATDNDNGVTESVKKIVVETVSGNDLRGGEEVSIKATVISNRRPVNRLLQYDRVDFYYTEDASNPDWIFITTANPIVGESVVTFPRTTTFATEIRYTLPQCLSSAGCNQAVRVALRSGTLEINSDDGNHKPTSDCANEPHDDVDDLVFPVLPSQRPQDMCDFQTLITLDENLDDCNGDATERLCLVDTVKVVEVTPGVYYEYIPLPCVHLPFYGDPSDHLTNKNGPVKLFANWNLQLTMCGNKKIPSALSTCCGGYSDRMPYACADGADDCPKADVLSEYRREKLTYAGNEARCQDWGRSSCDPQRVGPTGGHLGHCTYHQSCADISANDRHLESPHLTRWHWTTASCSIQVKVMTGGLIAIVHAPEETKTVRGEDFYPTVQSHVNPEKTVSYFHVQWDDTNTGVGQEPYPTVSESCGDGVVYDTDYCLCDTSVTETMPYDALPTRAEVLELTIGAFDPSMFTGDEAYTLVGNEVPDGVTVYKKNGMDDYTTETVFRVKDEFSNEYIYLKNIMSVVTACGSFHFRNSPTFFDIVDPELVSAYQETDAYIDHVHNHPNTPPSVCLMLHKHYGYSNPTQNQVLGCSEAFKTGVYTWTNPDDDSDELVFGSLGERGNLKAVAASIVLSNEALSVEADLDPNGGTVISPLLRLMHLSRSFSLTKSDHQRLTAGFLEAGFNAIVEGPYIIPDQFSFYNPFFYPAGPHQESGLTAPEGELLTLGIVAQSQNTMYNLPMTGLGYNCNAGPGPAFELGTFRDAQCGNVGRLEGNPPYRYKAGYLDFATTGTSTEVVGQLALLMLANRISPASRTIIEDAFEANLTAEGGGLELATRIAQVLMLSTPEFATSNLVQPNGTERPRTPTDTKVPDIPYKAIIHIDLFGGQDSMNMLTPHPDGCQALYDEYRARRGVDTTLPDPYINSLGVNELTKIEIGTDDSQPPQPCSSFGVNNHLSKLAEIYNAGDGLFFSNIGTMSKPVDVDNFKSETTAQLFSHYDMKKEELIVDVFRDRPGSGILGRMADTLGNNRAMGQISMQKILANIIGDPSLGRKIDVISSRNELGVDQFYRVPDGDGPDVSKRVDMLPTILSLNQQVDPGTSGLHANLWSQKLVDTYYESTDYRNWLSNVDSSVSADIPEVGIGYCLKQIVKLIQIRDLRHVNQDVFGCELAGFDTHFDTKTELAKLYGGLNEPLWYLREALMTLNLWDDVVVVLTSEFGRTITLNGSSGTDHGYGGNTFMMGGKVKGGRILGTHPDTYYPSKYVTERGVWIPTTSYDAKWYGISQWFGVTDETALAYVLPNKQSFGCHLYSEVDLFEDGTESLPACGGDKVDLEQQFIMPEERLLNPDEQKQFCEVVVSSMNDSNDSIQVTCVVLDQIISPLETTRRHLSPGQTYSLTVLYTVESDQLGVVGDIVTTMNDNSVQEEAAAVVQTEEEVSVAPVEVVQAPPSASPTSNPSKFPSKAPTTPGSPTSSPTTAPPTTAKPTNNPTVRPTSPPTTTPTFEFSFDGELVIAIPNGDICDLTSSEIEELMEDITTVLTTNGCPTNSEGELTSCTFVVQEPDCTRRRGLRTSRRLEDFVLQFTVEIEAVCDDTSCTNADDISDEIYNDIKANLQASIADGSLLSNLQAQSSGPASTLLGTATVSVGDFTVVVFITPLASTDFYPDWTGNTQTCSNDGNAPLYMKVNGGYFENTLLKCCTRWFSWDINQCLGEEPDVSGFYPDWGSSDIQCLDANVTLPPNYMIRNPTQWLYDSAEECCSKRYNWSENECLSNSGSGTTDVGTGNWYVDWVLEKCVRDCEDSSDSSCGGLAYGWDPLHDNASDCCLRLWWIDEEDCTN